MFLKSDETYNVSVFLWNTVITCFIDITNLKYNLFRDIPFVLNCVRDIKRSRVEN